MRPVLGLDIATHCGWALVEADRVVRSGCLRMTPRQGDHPGLRYLQFARFLQAGPWPAGVVLAIEDVRSHARRGAGGVRSFGVTAAHVYGGLRAIAEAWAATGDVSVIPIAVGSWKKGIGCARGAHASKAEVLRQVQLLGYRPASQDEADAIGIALSATRNHLLKDRVACTHLVQRTRA